MSRSDFPGIEMLDCGLFKELFQGFSKSIAWNVFYELIEYSDFARL